MKNLFFFVILIFVSFPNFAQHNSSKLPKKGTLSVTWGWNWSAYTPSDIHFKGEGHDFTIRDVKASDRPSTFDMNTYFVHFTTPQYNFKLAYFLTDNWNFSFGVDHMKYVMTQDQYVTIDGTINTGGPYDGQYNSETIQLTSDFLTFEHTDGLNYLYLGVNRFDELFNFEKINFANIAINLTEGVSGGVYYPKTNSKLLGNDRFDEFRVSGFGFDANIGLNITFFNYFFIEGDLKGGYVNMPNVYTTPNPSDRADQTFFYTQYNFVLGANIPLGKKES
ncbi:hypothetical protein [Flammeovirga kamogawensis]|uniref:Outer membrane beta-barrel protein n=1 Tax=Flammeovirga kamogawensis TaxID=373891 RepID=A0ABX8GY25_9BACT|nr:hypothetical protein [Flammeovirga kamogawensis]MBB6458939.1 hypothetical protein [Flammeovirga kamogawensis]QWG08515.1 hypothetical protein KM029_06145 [Flammeovirga kamogawensis]TRX66808.1 hypothetical protein EO216_01195 [Flammeovirga kamogawensis]